MDRWLSGQTASRQSRDVPATHDKTVAKMFDRDQFIADFFGVERSEWDPETLRERRFDMEKARKAFEDAGPIP
jgi:hypothetical protein